MTTTTITAETHQQEEEAPQGKQQQKPKQIEEQATPGVPYYLRPNEMQREMNSRMAELVPELDSKLVVTPMLRSRWYLPSEDYDEEGVPCFIPASKEEARQPRPDYIWMPKRHDLDAGYYHLSTQEAFIQAYEVFRRRIPRRGWRALCKKKTHEDTIDAKIKDLLYLRFAYDFPPDDVHAARMRLVTKQSTGGRAKAFGRAAYLPTITTTILLGFGGGG